jgi:DNA helicase IV
MAHPDVPAEQAHVDHAYARLQQMRETATRMLRDAFGERGGTFQALTERDIRVRTSLSRLEQLQIGVEALIFGRIDRVDITGGDQVDVTGEESGATGVGIDGSEAFHIGRLAISDVDQEPLVVDWRAPIAEPFYRATGAHPMQLRRRRHFLTEGQRIIDVEDELFGGEGEEEGAGLGLSGSTVLLSALARSRTGRMRDIVATVQREQDEIIRGPLGGVLVVQGGPGTGKTAVALHRAAYLLYTHRFPLERQGVLVVGPNPTFLRYIEHVLPSLGESGVELSTVSGLFGPPGAAGRIGRDDGNTTRLKGDPRMVRFLARAVGDRQRPLRRTVRIPYGRAFLRLTPSATAQIVAAAKRRPGYHNGRRRLVENLLWRHLLADAQRRAPAPEVDPDQLHLVLEGEDGTPETIDLEPAGTPLTAADLGRTLRRVPEVVEALERMWPLLTPQAFLHDLLGARPLLALAGQSILRPEEVALLHRAREPSVADVAWTDADIPLLDEARALLGPVRRTTTPGEGEIRTFGHVVVDEAQDLSPMQLRMLSRRSLSGSMTVVGDIAQATGGWAPSSWNQVVEHLPARRGWRLAELTVNYRTPSEIMDLAGVILEQFAPGMRAPEAVRSVGEGPEIISVSGDAPFRSAGLPAEVARAVASELAHVAAADQSGTVGVVVPESLVRPVAQSLSEAGLPFGLAAGGALDFPVALLGVTDAKGLEFDVVVVVEPARLVAESRQGLRALYVAVTRATQRLVVIHAEALPDSLARAAESSA